jgi:hypothetical protein
MDVITISTKEIRNDLEGFLQKLKHGRIIQVLYRSKLLVTVIAQNKSDLYLAKDAGTPTAAKRSVDFVKNLPYRKQTFDPKKSFKELYHDTQTL